MKVLHYITDFFVALLLGLLISIALSKERKELNQ